MDALNGACTVISGCASPLAKESTYSAERKRGGAMRQYGMKTKPNGILNL